MNADLQKTLLELEETAGAPEGAYAALVAALQNAPVAETRPDFTACTLERVRQWEEARRAWRLRACRAAAAACAALALAAGLAVWTGLPHRGGAVEAELAAHQTEGGFFSRSAFAPHVQAFAVLHLAEKGGGKALAAAVRALAESQNAQGGWSGAETSARNVAALEAAARAGAPGAAAALKRGRRYLRNNAIAELTAAQIARDADALRRRMGAVADAGLYACVASLRRK